MYLQGGRRRGTVIATYPVAPALPSGPEYKDVELHVISCNYNGWADVPEEEREGLEAFEAAGPPDVPSSGASPLAEPVAHQLVPVRWVPPGVHHRRAA
jgi:hypothetical protein